MPPPPISKRLFLGNIAAYESPFTANASNDDHALRGKASLDRESKAESHSSHIRYKV